MSSDHDHASEETPELHGTASDRLAADGQRYTSGRRQLLELLNTAGAPITIPELLERDNDLAQSSVYRNLTVLEKAGVVQRIVTNDEFSRYELAEDLTAHHHHLVCTACGSVTDFHPSAETEHELEASMEQAASIMGFQVQGHRLDLFGLCESCK